MHTGKMTKIIATIGPSSESEDLIRKLILSGVNIFRFNLKHNTKEWHIERINRVNKVAEELNLIIGILVDLQGPEIRIETFEEKDVNIKVNERLVFCNDFDNSALGEKEAGVKKIRVSQKIVCDSLKPGDRFSIDDGMIEFEVETSGEGYFVALSKDDGLIQNRKGLNLIGTDIALPSLIEEDLDKLNIATIAKVDFIALSFVRTSEDIRTLKREMDERNVDAKIISKVESQKGVDNVNEIIEASDGIMIARGDLGVEVPLEQVTYIQKEIIKKCRLKCKPVIVATQMLESMIDKPRPTRAEAADVANAVYDGTDAVMLSEETASGQFPVEAFQMMAKIAQSAEEEFPHPLFLRRETGEGMNLQQAITYTASLLAEEVGAKVIVTPTESGSTARWVSKLRPRQPILALTPHLSTVRELNLSWGVDPVLGLGWKDTDEMLERSKRMPKELGMASKGEKIVIIAGVPISIPGTTNLIKVEVVE